MANTVSTELVHHGERRDRAGRRRVPRERREQLLAAFRESGLTAVAFAEREGVCYTTFCHWLQRAKHAPRVSGASTVRFAEVALPLPSVSASGLEVQLADGTVVRGGGVEELAALVRALRS